MSMGGCLHNVGFQPKKFPRMDAPCVDSEAFPMHRQGRCVMGLVGAFDEQFWAPRRVNFLDFPVDQAGLAVTEMGLC